MCMKKTEAMLCCLRELVIAEQARTRAWNEFLRAMLGDIDDEAIRALIPQYAPSFKAWMMANPELDPRALDAADLSDLLLTLGEA